MFEKAKVKAQIRRCKSRIAELEQKRIRSQASLVDSILTKQDPSDEDVDYFNKYTQQINTERQYLKKLTTKLEELNVGEKK